MEKPPPNLVQNSMHNAYKSKDHYPQKAKGMSFFAFVFSIFVYISIFYIFNLSASNLVNTTKFWFFISNTLIIIIAVDYGSYSSSSSKDNISRHDLYDEYVMRSQRSAVPSINQTSYREINKARNIPEEEEQDDQVGPSRKKREEADEVHGKRQQHDSSHRRKLSIVPESEPLRHSVSLREKKLRSALKCDINEGCSSSRRRRHTKKVVPRALQRSQSEIVKRVVIDESKNIVRRIETEKYEQPDCDEEENEYANMSNEELNRRVEEFIERFNKQIRLQGEVYSK